VSRRALPLLILLPLACASAPAAAVTQSASVNASVSRPLTLAALQSLDLGTIVLSLGTWSGATAGISRNGVVTCTAKLTCSGAPRAAQFKVTGSNKMVVLITAPNVTLTNQSDASQKLTLVVDKPAQVTLTSSGEPGVNFNIGGSIALSSATGAGIYSGTLQVTVDYQ
jgi:Domain of unknown function (DUF4402)